MLKESFVDKCKEIKRNDWSLIYNPEFEKFREKYKNIISTIQKVLEGESVDGFKAEMLRHTAGGKTYFTVEVDGEKFFIKKIPENHKQGGVDEFKAAVEAKNRIADAGIEKVKVIDYVFGFNGNNVRFVVSKYDERLNSILVSYMDECLEQNRIKELHDLDDRFTELKKVFSGYYDFKVENMAYDKETDEIILFDLNTSESMLVESPGEEL